MEPLFFIVVPGILGGILLAILLSRTHVPEKGGADSRLEPMSTNLINMSSIRVAGVGGLGMVAMAIVVAIFVPRIRLTMVISLVLGAVMASVMIARRRRQGALSTNRPGAHTML